MQTLVRDIRLNFAVGEKKLRVGNLSLKKNYIKILDVERFKERGCLFKKKHNALQTQFDLTGAEDCQLLTFDKNGMFKTVCYYRNHMDAPFSFFITASSILMFPDTLNLPVQTTYSMLLFEYPPIRGADHIYGTDTEIVEILAANPDRFYVCEFGIWTPPSELRIKLLNDIYENALKRENEILCKRIEVVKEQLLALPAYQ